MKKKIVILGSTGSIGKTVINIIESDKKNFEIKLLTANKNYKKLLYQAKKFRVKNLIITDNKSFIIANKVNKNPKIKIYNNFNVLNKIFKKKVDYTISSITGVEGLIPTFKIIKHSKIIAIANKEAIICGWDLINKELKKRKTEFIPVDSEHFSTWYGLKNNNDIIDKIFLTASGGPFKNLPIKKFNNINVKQALKHPNWKMGKKISIDSATMMNKVFEIIEARNIFDLSYKKLSILVHPDSYLHSIIKFKNGLIKLIAHETDMKIPILNSIYQKNNKFIFQDSQINLKKLNKLELSFINKQKFPLVKILNHLSDRNSLFETVIVSANDELVKMFLNKKIKFLQIAKKLILFIKRPEFKKYKLISPKNIEEIVELNKYVRLKINSKSI